MNIQEEAKQLWNKLRELEDIFDQYLGFPNDCDIMLIDHWVDRFEKLKINLILSSFKRVSREVFVELTVKDIGDDDKDVRKYYKKAFIKYWQSLTNQEERK